MQELAERLREHLGPETEIRFAPRAQMLLVRVVAAGTPYWIGVPVPPRAPAEDMPTRALPWTLTVLALLLVAAFLFARYLARPLRQLASAVARVGRGETPPPLPESGPSEIAAVNRGFNAMTASLRQIEQDRAVLLAGVSHDLRTPLARLRLGVEMSTRDDGMRTGMVADIEEMDRIIGQFLHFARSDTLSEHDTRDLNAVVRACTERYIGAGRRVSFVLGPLPDVPIASTAISRLTANLIDNALAYGAPPVEVTTRAADGFALLEVADRGPGIAADQVARTSGRRGRGRLGSRHRRSHCARAWRALRPGSARRRRPDRARGDPRKSQRTARSSRGMAGGSPGSRILIAPCGACGRGDARRRRCGTARRCTRQFPEGAAGHAIRRLLVMRAGTSHLSIVVPAKAGIQCRCSGR
jgi:signal transduction histidine kinase